MRNSYSVIYSSEAVNDLTEILEYISLTLLASETAEKQIRRIIKAAGSLDIFPERHPMVDWDPWKSMNMHKFPVDNFIIYYVVNRGKNEVTIIRILYSGRDINEVLNN